MNRRLVLVVLLLIGSRAFAGLTWVRSEPRKPNVVRIVVPTFSGNAVAVNISSMLLLQIWDKLRVPEGVGANSVGEVAWDRLLESDPERINEIEYGTGAQLILWGHGFKFADGTIVQASLNLPRCGERDCATTPDESFQQWVLTVPFKERNYEFTADLPSRTYDFDPVVLPNEIIEQYGSITAIKIYATEHGDKVQTRVGTQEFRPIEKRNDAVRVRYRDESFREHEGWIRLPELRLARIPATEFTSALARVMRRDWSGASELFSHVIADKRTPVSVQIDALVLRALASWQQKKLWKADIAAANELNHYVRSTILYSLMLNIGDFARAQQEQDAAHASQAVTAIEELLKDKGSYFAEDDKRLTQAKQLAAAYRSEMHGTP